VERNFRSVSFARAGFCGLAPLVLTSDAQRAYCGSGRDDAQSGNRVNVAVTRLRRRAGEMAYSTDPAFTLASRLGAKASTLRRTALYRGLPKLGQQLHVIGPASPPGFFGGNSAFSTMVEKFKNAPIHGSSHVLQPFQDSDRLLLDHCLEQPLRVGDPAFIPERAAPPPPAPPCRTGAGLGACARYASCCSATCNRTAGRSWA
jgi:hypothetical protein